ncbi:carboxypeptidase regulatory-like domain-containing protein [Paenarthrobacter nitroguajacolicus]|uniref:Carboxypeptidase regulatory-like domain-containing protein n=2 Tax=Paenarthrobacter nitroguajacolicus TaxID=211146 RepID=A0A558HAT7_PAENT|nr:carboxypeptidase regulatory-like domain-containing protein [Paenarthrobacter nitroguajacolicus]
MTEDRSVPSVTFLGKRTLPMPLPRPTSDHPLQRSWRGAWAILAAAVLVAAGLFAGAAPASAATYTFKGVVKGKLTATATATALGNVWVGAYTNDDRASYVAGAWSAADGSYSFTVPAAGSYKLWTTCSTGPCSATYADEWNANKSSSYGSTPVAVTDAAPVTTYNPQLEAFGSMSGRVTNKAGQALTAVSISASPSGGGQVSSTKPDANGYFTLTKIPPNQAYISVRDESGQRLYLEQYWNGTGTVDAYTAATVPSGVKWTNVNFVLKDETIMEATVTNPAGVPIADVGYIPYVYNDATGAWDGPQMGPLTSDTQGKIYWRMAVGKKYKLCVSDTFYEGAPREKRYKPECYDNTPTKDTATVLTATAAGQRVKFTMQLDEAGLSLAPGRPYVYGSAQAGKTLTVDPGVWGPAPVVLAYQWQRSTDGTELQDIAGATATTYVPTAADAGYDIWAKVTGTKAGYAPHYDTVHAGKSGADAVTASKPFTILGTPSAGNTLTVDHGTLTPAPDFGPYYDWFVNGVPDYRSNGPTFLLQASDAGKKVTARLSVHDWPLQPYYGQASVTVAAGTLTAPVPTVSGTAKVGSVLTAVPGAWGPAPVTLAYQWFRSGVAVTGATSATYTLVAADLGKTMTVRVTGSKTGFTTAAKTSASTAAVAAGTLTAPVPTVSGTAKVGSVLTAVPGTWGPAPVTLAYQWFRSGVAVTGATSATYTLVAADLGKTMTVRVTGSKTGFTTAAKTSAATAAVAVGTLTAPTPTVSGTKTVGSTLTATPGTWGPAPVTLTYQWFRGNTAISGATAQTYKLVAADKGSAIKVRVTGTKAGYTTVARYSAATSLIG